MGDKSKVVGVTYEGRQNVISEINEITDKLLLMREPDNKYDKNAIGVWVKKYDGTMHNLGYVDSSKTGLAAILSEHLDAGKEVIITDYHVIGDKAKGHSLGVLYEYEIIDTLKVAQ